MPGATGESAAPLVPTATYRLQFNAAFDFNAALSLVPYLEALGVSHVYASPIFKARPGSAHGYDVIDPTAINPELGGEDGFMRLSRELQRRRIGLILDIVPNHMAATGDNAWWRDVLRLGRASPFASFFDIDWERGAGKVVLPMLGQPLAEVLAAREIALDSSGEAPCLRYFEHALPIDPATLSAARSSSVEDLLALQHYEPCHWRDAPLRVNYRRFFDINDLVALQMHRPEVFEAAHALIRTLVADGHVQGLRVDHVDGLRDPRAYLEALRDRVNPKFLVVEKILVGDERLPGDWPVDGTTGYDWLNAAQEAFIDPAGAGGIITHWRQLAGERRSFEEVARLTKLQVIDQLFPGDLARLAAQFQEAPPGSPFKERSQRCVASALRLLTAGLPVYRTYIDARGPSQADEHAIAASVAAADASGDERRDLQVLAKTILQAASGPPQLARAVEQWQQHTGPIMAKGVEDTTLYRFTPLTAMNEVGGEAVPRSDAAARFHAFNLHRAEAWPRSLSATSTHDTKRSEDARARLAALSELAYEWTGALDRWRAQNASHRTQFGDGWAPSPRDEHLFYQSLIAVWPLDGRVDDVFVQRLQDYMVKAAREAKLETSWIEPAAAYEAGLRRFVEAALDSDRSREFLRELQRFQARTALGGAIGSLACVLAKCASPGVPDFYRGGELWDLSLVDPDNRRPVDFNLRGAMMAELAAAWRADPAALLRDCRLNWRDGRIKMLVSHIALRLRREHHAVFESGRYVPLEVGGPRAQDIIAFARIRDERWVLVAFPTRIKPLLSADDEIPGNADPSGSGSIRLPPGGPQAFTNCWTREIIRANSRGDMALSSLASGLPLGLACSA